MFKNRANKNAFAKACKKRMKRVEIAGVEYESMAAASLAMGRAYSYVSSRYKNFDKTMPNGDKIVVITTPTGHSKVIQRI